ncbi:hypothetical protein N5J31_17465 [Acinetobacter johnsonii]|uniref:hypothetical protein n=1 Tax=Acinetobacter johnsonii TaxID=40214 RepID=UPI00244C10F3|nr:hypothetical protein [Acinetobacter johnsonii]MDH2048631.1 hypothetical protein [Acinetobacter johnsonii]
MTLKGLSKSFKNPTKDQEINDFITGANKRVNKFKVSEVTYRRLTFSLTEELDQEIDKLLIDCRVAKANRSMIVRAALYELKKLSQEELQQSVLQQIT